MCDSAGAALEGADALVVVTEWKQFRSPDFARLKARSRDAVVFDGRNLYEPAEVEAAGLAYYGIGRGRSVRCGPDAMDHRPRCESRLTELEMRLAFQEHALAELSDALAASRAENRAQCRTAAARARRPEAIAWRFLRRPGERTAAAALLIRLHRCDAMSDSLRDQLLGLGFKPAPEPERKPRTPRGKPARGTQHARSASARRPDAGKPQPQRQATSAWQARAGRPQRRRRQGRPHRAAHARGDRSGQGLCDPRAEGEGRAHRGRAPEAGSKRASAAKPRRSWPSCSRTRPSTTRRPRSHAISITAARSSASMSLPTQFKALNAGELGVVQLDGRYLLVTAALLAQADAIFAAGDRAEGRSRQRRPGRPLRRSAIPGA